jgi:hypothetical protein
VTPFTSTLRSEAVDKLDVLFMIDNSTSMGDKQALLAQAVPDMISRLVSPDCVDTTGKTIGPSTNGQCTTGKLEFPPVHDMHLGIVSSSLGARGGDVCNPANMNPANLNLNAHQDDRGELVARGGVAEASVANAGSLNFLGWFPTVAANQGAATPPVPAETAIGAPGQAGTLIGDFASMIQGVNEHGCGYEAQNEAWYRFLVQPDPYDSITVGANNSATVTGVDSVLLQERAAFLRPDSLLAIIVVTDENEQVSNPLAVGKQAWAFETYPFKSAPANAGAPEGTAACGSFSATPGPNPGPTSTGCTSCGFSTVQSSPTFAQLCPADPPNGTGGARRHRVNGAKTRHNSLRAHRMGDLHLTRRWVRLAVDLDLGIGPGRIFLAERRAVVVRARRAIAGAGVHRLCAVLRLWSARLRIHQGEDATVTLQCLEGSAAGM